MSLSSPLALFEVLEFNEENLAQALSNHWISPDNIRREKYHFHFLLKHLSYENDDRRVKTILIENQYNSHSYQNDYATDYSLGFYPHSRFCKRIHFFSDKFSVIHELLVQNSLKSVQLWKSYRGFVTVKPLPKARLGTVVLEPFLYTAVDKRVFCAVRDYSVHVLGKKLPLRSLAFQEQDGVVSACATVALWSAIHMLSSLFQVALLTPNEINTAAHFNGQNRPNSLPGIGLDLHQICGVIERIGLNPELRTLDDIQGEIKDKSFIKRYIYAYLKMGLPVLVGLKFDEGGQHLITIVGYKEIDSTISGFQGRGSSNPAIYADQLHEFYAHDDQTGPFSKINFLEKNGRVATSRWKDFQNTEDKHQGNIANIIVPLPKEIRITFEDIYEQIISFEQLFFKLIKTDQKFVWDIYLVHENDYKANIQVSDSLYSADLQSEILNTFFPTNIWIARGTVQGFTSIEFIFDATSIPSATNYCFKVLFFDIYFTILLGEALIIPDNKDKKSITRRAVLNEFLNGFYAERANTWNAIKETIKDIDFVQIKQSLGLINTTEAEEIVDNENVKEGIQNQYNTNEYLGEPIDEEKEIGDVGNEKKDDSPQHDLPKRLVPIIDAEESKKVINAQEMAPGKPELNLNIFERWKSEIEEAKDLKKIIRKIINYCKENYPKEDLNKTIITISYSYNSLRNDNTAGILSDEYYGQKVSKIVHSLLIFIDDLSEQKL